MRAAAGTALAQAGVGIDDCAHLDLYSCFGSSVNFMRDALGIGLDDRRSLTVTGGLPYHGGAGSDYLTHAIAQMVRVLRNDPGSYGLVTGVGMHMTKHVAGVYSTTPGAVTVPDPAPGPTTRPIVERADGPAAVAAHTVVHGRDGRPEWGVVVCDLGDDAGSRTYARIEDPDLLADAATREWTGRRVRLGPHRSRDNANLVVA
jgi:acetyl-CoA C-acetyltransferase